MDKKSQAVSVASEWKPKDQVDEWIASVVANQTFADIGGIGERSVNERITTAVRCGAKLASMVDIRPSDYYEWDIFRGICLKNNLKNYQEVPSTDLNDPHIYEKIGSFYLVHSTGIFYHLPAPLATFQNLAKLVDKYLIVNTVTVPSRIENQYGVLNFSDSTAAFWPEFSDRDRAIWREYYANKFGKWGWTINDVAPQLDDPENQIMPFRENGQYSCWPYWWLLTDHSFRTLVNLMGFKILSEYKWEDHSLHIFAEKIR